MGLPQFTQCSVLMGALIHPIRMRSILMSPLLISPILVTLAGTMVSERSSAQSLSPCQPPRSNEYLLLVRNQRADTQTQLQQLLPPTAVLATCDYLSENVVRVEGFSSTEIAQAWAQYLADAAGLQAFIARPAIATAPATGAPSTSGVGGTSSPLPAASSTPGASVTPAPATQTRPGTYSPQPLGAGYAVLVNYFNRPEVATDVGQVTARAVGLVAYNQQPYLLAIYTTDLNAASTVLRALSDRGLSAAIVDSRGAVLLTPTVVTGN